MLACSGRSDPETADGQSFAHAPMPVHEEHLHVGLARTTAGTHWLRQTRAARSRSPVVARVDDHLGQPRLPASEA